MVMNDPSTLRNVPLLKWYFRTHGIKEKEIQLCEGWGLFDSLILKYDARGIEYAERLTEKIKRYRELTLDDLRKGIEDAPWAWPSAMRFQKVWYKSVRDIRTISGRPPILMCEYHGYIYYFNVGKEEPGGEAVEKMLEKGIWYVYTYSD